MFFEGIVNRGPTPALEKMLAFTEARQRVLAENVANADTPGYVTKQVDAASFQRTLRDAIDTARSGGEFRVRSTDQVRQDANGHLTVTPAEEPPENILFHDRTNMRIEEQMSMLAENAMMHQATAEMLRGKYEGLLKAIRGTMSG